MTSDHPPALTIDTTGISIEEIILDTTGAGVVIRIVAVTRGIDPIQDMDPKQDMDHSFSSMTPGLASILDAEETSIGLLTRSIEEATLEDR